MNGFQFAEDNPEFKESVQVAVDNMIGAGMEPEEITVEGISNNRMAEIKTDWYKCLTCDDVDQIKTHVRHLYQSCDDVAQFKTHVRASDYGVEHLDAAMNAEFERVLSVELEYQITTACVERQVRERGGL
jgi:hypothetical protein